MRTAPITAILLLWSAMAAADAEIEPLDGAFLEYLANLEADDSDWTVLAAADPDHSEAQSAPQPSVAGDAKSATKPPATRKPKAPTKPVDDR